MKCITNCEWNMQIFSAYYYCSFLLSKNLCRLFIHSPIFSLHKWNERDQCGYQWSVPSPQVQIRLSMHRCLSIKYICIFMEFESFTMHTEREIRIVQSRATATPACMNQHNDGCKDKPSNTNTLIDSASYHYWINTILNSSPVGQDYWDQVIWHRKKEGFYKYWY